jgi:hypothetical protein
MDPFFPADIVATIFKFLLRLGSPRRERTRSAQLPTSFAKSKKRFVRKEKILHLLEGVVLRGDLIWPRTAG